MYPIKTAELKLTSAFGKRKYNYQGKLIEDFHYGNDYIGGTEIVAFADGEVIGVQKIGKQYGTACYVRIKHSNGYQTLYKHLKSNSIVVNKGDKVKKGQKLGIIGNTGVATGIHLHFQIDKGSNATAIDPYDYVFGNKEFEFLVKQEEYTTGNYITLEDMNIRDGAGANFTIKKVKDMSVNGKKHATSTNLDSGACYKKGTEFTAQEIIKNGNEYWAKSPSGYICIKGASGKVYCKKIEVNFNS